jgi:hypothetical protein
MANAWVGKDGKVSIGTNSILGMGTWSINLGSVDELDASEFGDDWEKVVYGMKRGGTISFNGHFYPDNTSGQNAALQAFVEGTDLTDIRFYWNSTQYWRPNRTAGWFNAELTTGAGTPVSTVRITACDINSDKSGIASISFSAKCSGSMSHN